MTTLCLNDFDALQLPAMSARSIATPIIERLAERAASAMDASQRQAVAVFMARRTSFALSQETGLLRRWTLMRFTPNGQSVAVGTYWSRDAALRAAAAMNATL
jgi:hypothetical protein